MAFTFINQSKTYFSSTPLLFAFTFFYNHEFPRLDSASHCPYGNSIVEACKPSPLDGTKINEAAKSNRTLILEANASNRFKNALKLVSDEKNPLYFNAFVQNTG